MKIKLLQGDSKEVLKDLPDNSVDSIVTDPPYGLSFMGKKWDYDVPSVDIWKEGIRVLKPGGHLLAFGGTRTYHRLVVNIEDAGFEIRDQIQWLYGSGFPKSHNIKEGEFKGWGTALKPANEPIVLARKPLEKGLTVAENVQKWETGAINVDASRIWTSEKIPNVNSQNIKGHMIGSGGNGNEGGTLFKQHPQGRWPANIILDETAAEMLDEQSGQLSQCGGPKKTTHKSGMFGIGTPGTIYKEENRGASRFFYVAKASKKDRGAGNNHPTVKPIKLMEYLIKLITPPQGVVLDPFMGSGTTGVAAKNLQHDFIGIEMSPEYKEIAEKRIG